jgi:hypothetical protein
VYEVLDVTLMTEKESEATEMKAMLLGRRRYWDEETRDRAEAAEERKPPRREGLDAPANDGGRDREADSEV